MEPRRLISFFFISFLILISWNIIGRKLFPNWAWQQPNQQNQKDQVADDGDDKKNDSRVVNDDTSSDDTDDDKDDAPPTDDDNNNKGDDKGDEVKPDEPKRKLPSHPTKSVLIGSADPESGFGLSVELTPIGAAIRSATLNNKKFIVAENPKGLDPPPQLQVLGNNIKAEADIALERVDGKKLTFDVDCKRIDDILQEIDPTASTRKISWELIEPKKLDDSKTYTTATFRLTSPDGAVAFEKQFSIAKRKNDADPATDPTPYLVNVKLTLRNLSKQKLPINYTLQGPVGLPLEHADSGRFFRAVKAGFIEEDGSITSEALQAYNIVDAEEDNEIETWKAPVQYIGVDVQYFSALMLLKNQFERQDFVEVTPAVTTRTRDKKLSDVSVLLSSRNYEIDAGKSASQDFQVYLGPKDFDILQTINADDTIDFGWFRPIGHFMIWLLKTFNSWGLPYGIAIILLTCVVRGLMFPISKKQALSQKRMKELQPEIAAIREKYKDDKQKMAQAQMELYRKANFNPFAGCLPLILQLPIFVALYSTVGSWVDLRMAEFLWIDNLAAPDGFIEFGRKIWLIGPRLNLLPILTIILFYVQQKMFMPPPSSPEMASQQKMMNFMLIIFLFIFYNMPSGLCVYFVASSLWGMGERKLLDILPEPPPKEQKPRKEGFFGRLMKQMQEAADMQQQLREQRDNNDNPPAKGGVTKRRR